MAALMQAEPRFVQSTSISEETIVKLHTEKEQ